MDLQTTVYRFFNDALQTAMVTDHDLDTQTAILLWQNEQGYTSPSVVTNWQSIALAEGIDYRGAFDMQNGFALGTYTISE